MTLGEYQRFIGVQATIEAMPGCDVAIKVLDVRSSFGRIDVLVTPVSGSGSTWVSINRVNFQAEE
jgi:hypothetical protein